MAGQIQLNGTSFASESGGTITVNNGTLGSSVVFPAGHVIQTVQHVTTSTASITSTNTNTFASFSTAFKKSITPIKTNSKILIFISMNVGNDLGTIHLELFRDGSVITGSIGDASGSRLRANASIRYNSVPYGNAVNNINFNFLDSPTISDPPTAIEYEIKATAGVTYSETFYLNRSATDYDADYGPRTSSTITLLEVAG